MYKKTSSPTARSRQSREEDDFDALLLPSVSSTSRPKASAIERCVAASYIKQLEDERNKAVREALLYRNLAEQMRKEKRDTHHKMSRQCETIRDFWRNTLVEGCSRSGKMVRQAMLNKKNWV